MMLYKTKHKITFLTLLFFAVSFYVFANKKDDLKTIFYTAGAMYEYGEYDKAIKEYNKIIEKGFESGAIYYNLGNCYFKKGKLGKALLNYEKAKRLIPRDSDLESNYKYARSLVKGGFIKDKRSWLIRFTDKVFKNFTINELSILLSCLYIIILAVIILSLYVRLIRKYRLAIIAVVIFVFLLALLSFSYKVSLLGKEAIVVKENTDAKFEPLKSATSYFTLYEGMKAAVVKRQGGWCKIKRVDGKTGWVKMNAIEIF